MITKVKSKLNNIDPYKCISKIDTICWCIIIACAIFGFIGHIVKMIISLL